MLDSRPLSEQKLSDVEAFLRQQIGEGLTLDYKRQLSPENKEERSELCKDVSALANSSGGLIVYGIEENQPDRTPKLPPFGTPRKVGRQAIEEWASQILQSGVQPVLDLEIEAFELSNDPDKCILVIRTVASPSAPHMVTYREDNRYYGRFYRRGNFGNRIAEEYEVREMLERARRLYLGVEDEIARQGYADPLTAFEGNAYTQRLAPPRNYDKPSVARSQTPIWVSFLWCEPHFPDQ